MELIKKIKAKEATIGIIGLGYVGILLLIRFCEENFYVIGFDIDTNKVGKLNAGKSYIKHIPNEKIKLLKKMNYSRPHQITHA
jgi:UDP-N-acetyl-D-glucosamine dehydrogenase